MNATPAEIKHEIHMALAADFKANSYGGKELPIPARTFRLVDDAINAANEKAAQTYQSTPTD